MSSSVKSKYDLVAMLEQWELANFKPEYQFVVWHTPSARGIR